MADTIMTREQVSSWLREHGCPHKRIVADPFEHAKLEREFIERAPRENLPVSYGWWQGDDFYALTIDRVRCLPGRSAGYITVLTYG